VIRSRQFLTLAVALAAISCWTSHPGRRPERTGFLRTAAPDDLQLAFTVIGDGPDTVVVLHGGPGLPSGAVRGALNGLADRWTFILYDQRGRGRSTLVPDSGELSAARDVDDLDQVRSYFHLQRMTLIAHHWGAVLAALYAKAHPDRVNRLALLSPSFPQASFLFWAATLPNDESATTRYLAALQAGEDTGSPLTFCRRYWGFAFAPIEVTDPSLVARLWKDMCDAPPAALRDAPRVGRLVASSLHGLDLRDTLAAIHVPALILQGRGDTASLAAGNAWTEWLPEGRRLVLSSPGLFPWLGEREPYVTALARFLDGAWPAEAVRISTH